MPQLRERPGVAPNPRPFAPESEARLFPAEGTAGGCASGECLPEVATPPPPEPPRSSTAPVPAAAHGKDNPLQSTVERWRAAVASVRDVSVRHAAALAFGRLVRLEPGEVALAFPRDAGFHRASVVGSGRALIEKALSEHFGRPTRVTEAPTESAATASISLAEEQAKDRADHERSIDHQARHHPAVLAAMRILGGEIEQVDVYERDRPAVDDDAPDDSH